MEPVGVVGLGLMGGALAGRFRAGRRRVVGFDPRPECRQRLADLGGEAAGSVAGVFAAARTVVLSLPNSTVVAAVLDEVGEAVAGATVVDTTTGDPDETAETGKRLADRGADYLDATLTGSSAVAAAGEVVVTAGGPAAVFARAEPLFRLFAKAWYHVGPWGAGARAKLAVNLVLGLNRLVLAEGLEFARRCGLDVREMLDILRGGAAYSRAMDAKGRKMIDGDFAPEAKLAQHLKDVRLILEYGARAGASLPVSRLHEGLLAGLVARGLGDLDNSAVVRAFDEDAG
ncbi:MAG: NAD(P)-dependent oxidoreductase [Isosphaera sp.]|nr:NAD(P)-dependent oxidoreductase [Isosphaera sp.]